MTFKSTACKFNGDDAGEIDGKLTLLGVTKPLTLNVERWKCRPDPRTKGQRYHAAATPPARSSAPSSA